MQIALTCTQIWWTTEVGLAFARLEEGYENAIKDYNKKQVRVRPSKVAKPWYPSPTQWFCPRVTDWEIHFCGGFFAWKSANPPFVGISWTFMPIP